MCVKVGFRYTLASKDCKDPVGWVMQAASARHPVGRQCFIAKWFVFSIVSRAIKKFNSKASHLTSLELNTAGTKLIPVGVKTAGVKYEAEEFAVRALRKSPDFLYAIVSLFSASL